jgi:hypothetical protein
MTWQVACAIAAAFTFFSSVSCGEQEIEFTDASFGHRNSTEVLLNEAWDLFLDEVCSCVISIGTSISGTITIEGKRLSILNASKKMATTSEAVHGSLAKRFPDNMYFRFNVTKGLGDIMLPDWKKSSKTSAHTSKYHADIDIGRAISRCARILTQG